MIKENIQEIEKNIQQACIRANRKREEVTLIVVTKTQPNSLIMEAYDAGVRHFGENRVQEFVTKYDLLPGDASWHMIGHLQRNKVKDVVGKVKLIQSVDSLRLAETIEKECVKKNIDVDILVEVNVAEEESKFGIGLDEVESFVKQLSKFNHIHVKGLMTIAPFVDNPETNREVFARLKKISVDIERQNIDNVTMRVLSMGMTNDYQVAIEEGSTMIRVGTAVFGVRYA